MKRPFGSLIMTRINFEVKRAFYSEIGGHVLTPNFDMCQGRVLQRRKGSASYDRWIWRGGRVPRSRKERLTRYFGFGLAGVILFLEVVFIA